MMNINIYIILFCLLIFCSCEETIILDTAQVEPKLVIRSHITSNNRYQLVELSLSVGFYHKNKPPVITDAEVLVRDLTEGISHTFTSNPGENEGIYISDNSFQGKVGHTYELEVNWEGKVYTARETMLPVTPLDSLSSRINPFEFQDPGKPGYYYEVLLYAAEPQETNDYYFFKFYRNDSLIYASGTDIYFSDDKFLGERIADLPAPIFYKRGDVARVEMFSVTRDAYIYLNDLFNILNNDSGMFSPPPANPRNNISNGALGYFMVSDISADYLIIE